MYFYIANYAEMFKMRQKLLNTYNAEGKITDNTAINLYDFFFIKGIKA